MQRYYDISTEFNFLPRCSEVSSAGEVGGKQARRGGCFLRILHLYILAVVGWESRVWLTKGYLKRLETSLNLLIIPKLFEQKETPLELLK